MSGPLPHGGNERLGDARFPLLVGFMCRRWDAVGGGYAGDDVYVDSLASPRENPTEGKDDDASPAIGGRYAGGALTPLVREHEPLKRALPG